MNKEVIRKVVEETCKKKVDVKDIIYKVLIDRIEEDQLIWKWLQIEESKKAASELKTCLTLWQRKSTVNKGQWMKSMKMLEG